MCDAPALWNVEVQHLTQFSSRIRSDRISPGAERYKQFSLLIERHVAVHHAGKTNRCKLCHFHTVLVCHILRHLAVAVLHTGPDVLQTVSPDSVLQTVFPVVCAGCDRHVLLINQHCLDSGGTKLNSEHRLAV